jgi:hypothetical protein
MSETARTEIAGSAADGLEGLRGVLYGGGKIATMHQH